MHYRHLYYFVRIVEAGSFSQAARTIHVAQPALSQQIAELEASLGVPLLQRSARGVKPTAAGQKFYDEASSILRKYENLPGLVRSNSGRVDGQVSLGMPASLSTTLVGKAARQISKRHAVPLVRYLGEADVNVLVRLSAFILVCIGIQIGWSGLSALLAGLQHPAVLP